MTSGGLNSLGWGGGGVLGKTFLAKMSLPHLQREVLPVVKGSKPEALGPPLPTPVYQFIPWIL